jgi:hypothetical protein
MIQWHEQLVARVGLRIAGITLLVSTWFEGASLHDMIATNSNVDASAAQILLAGLMFASASTGLLLTLVGAGLWKPVGVSDRWATCDPAPVAHGLETAL